MTDAVTTTVVLRRAPTGDVTPDCFEVVAQPVPQPACGEVLVRVVDLSLDPYLRSTIVGRHLDDPAVPLGGVIPGRSVGQVFESRSPDVPVGAWVLAETGWREVAAVPATAARLVQVPPGVPRSAALGALGMPGLTAYAALRRHLRPAVGDTVVISSATGGVGAVAGQLARLAGARTVAVVGSARKAETARDALGYSAAVVRTDCDWRDRLAEACPRGIDGYLHMGDVATLDGVLEQLALRARVSLVGLVDQPDGPRSALSAGAVMRARASVHGMVVYDHADLETEQRTRVGDLLREGRIVLHEDRYRGLENAPEAFTRLLQGATNGKVVVEVASA